MDLISHALGNAEHNTQPIQGVKLRTIISGARFFADLGHVGIFLGHGLMIDAPDWGQPVQIQRIWWAFAVGAVRIA
jgi:hypothetical protein